MRFDDGLRAWNYVLPHAWAQPSPLTYAQPLSQAGIMTVQPSKHSGAEEATGLPYASKIKATDRDGKTVPVMHACGHDMHVAWLVGATTLLARARDTWQGRLMAVFQPAEETAEGAQAMIDDGLFDRFPKPDVVLGQHVMVGPAGAIGGRAGVITSAGDSLQIRLFGRGAHGSMPQASIDPVVMASATVMRLQTIVSRELVAAEAARSSC
jgi:amidohydrolase